VSVYLISEVEVRDESLAERYRALAQESIARYGGRYVVRGAAPALLEGDWPDGRRVVVVEFPDAEAAERWYASAEYAPALVLRQQALDRRLLLVDGIDEPPPATDPDAEVTPSPRA
jgi:uncharacterized protein (DUF1330 family)